MARMVGRIILALVLLTGAARAQAVDLAYFTTTPADPDATIPQAEAEAFVAAAFDRLDRVLFDPAVKAAERAAAREQLMAGLKARSSWRRAEVAARLNGALTGLGISHVRLLDPAGGAALFRQFEAAPPAPPAGSDDVSAAMVGDVGVLTLRSFVVPRITLEKLTAAKARLAGARAILIDLRGNKGGAGSPVSYAIESVIGPDALISTERTRDGLADAEPFRFRGYAADAENRGHKADTALSAAHPFIEYRTRADAVRDPRPHFVLIDGRCGSACELFAGAAKQHGVPVLGVRSMGALLGADAFPLPWPGYALVAPTVGVTSPNGAVYEGVGVPPDVAIPECAGDGPACLDRAVAVAARRPDAQPAR